MKQTTDVLLGFDFGKVPSIGFAVGQRVTGTARPFMCYCSNEGIPQWEAIAKIIKDWHTADALIVGVP